MSRDSLQAQHFQLWLDLNETYGATTEQRLSRLCAWVLQADRIGALSGGRLTVRLFAAGEVVPAPGAFDAVVARITPGDIRKKGAVPKNASRPS